MNQFNIYNKSGDPDVIFHGVGRGIPKEEVPHCLCQRPPEGAYAQNLEEHSIRLKQGTELLKGLQ